MKIQENILLKNYTTFKIGGEARYFCVGETLDELKEALLWAQSKSLKTFVLGGGSNVLFSDDGFDGLVIKVNNQKFEKIDENEKTVVLKCGAGLILADLVKYCLENGYEGLEWAVGIPGTFGGAIRGNAGAFGSTIGDLIKSVEIIGKNVENFQLELMDKKNCDFEYRNSFLKKNNNLILWSAEIELKKGDFDKIGKKFKEYVQKRQENQPSLGIFPSAGSVFENPIVSQKVIDIFEEDRGIKAIEGRVPAGWLIDQCDLKGKKIGGALVSEIQANFIVNTGTATFEDVMILISLIKQKVRNRFGVQLKEEIEIVI